MVDMYQIAAGMLDALPIYWTATDWIVWAIAFLAMFCAASQARRTLRQFSAAAKLTEHKVPEKRHRVSERHFVAAMPLLLLEAAHRALRALLLFLSVLFAVSFVLSWYFVAFGLEGLVSWIYRLNGQERYFLLPVQQSVAELSERFRPVALLQLLAIMPLMATVIIRAFDQKHVQGINRFWHSAWFQFGHGAVLISSILLSYVWVWPQVREMIDTVLFASAASVDWGSILSQAILSPLYAQAVFSFAGLAYLVVYGVLVLLFIVNRLTGALKRREATEQLYERSRRLRLGVVELCGGASLSFAVTIGAVMLGRTTGSFTMETQMAVTPSLLLWNAFFDGLTLSATTALIGLSRRLIKSETALNSFADWVVADKIKRHGPTEVRASLRKLPFLMNTMGLLPIILLVFLVDILVAAFFAVMAIWVGLGAGDWAVDLREAFRMLFGLAPDGTDFSFSSQFWVMHTTFIPSVFYLGVLVYSTLLMIIWMIFGFVLRYLARTGIFVTILLTLAAVGAKRVVEVTAVPAIEGFVASGTYARTVNGVAGAVPPLRSPVEALDED